MFKTLLVMYYDLNFFLMIRGHIRAHSGGRCTSFLPCCSLSSTYFMFFNLLFVSPALSMMGSDIIYSAPEHLSEKMELDNDEIIFPVSGLGSSSMYSDTYFPPPVGLIRAWSFLPPELLAISVEGVRGSLRVCRDVYEGTVTLFSESVPVLVTLEPSDEGFVMVKANRASLVSRVEIEETTEVGDMKVKYDMKGTLWAEDGFPVLETFSLLCDPMSESLSGSLFGQHVTMWKQGSEPKQEDDTLVFPPSKRRKNASFEAEALVPPPMPIGLVREDGVSSVWSSHLSGKYRGVLSYPLSRAPLILEFRMYGEFVLQSPLRSEMGFVDTLRSPEGGRGKPLRLFLVFRNEGMEESFLWYREGEESTLEGKVWGGAVRMTLGS